GIPGGGTGQIYDALFGKQARVKAVLARHEQAAAIMADAYGRATGRPAAIMGQGVFMGSNATFGIMEAYASSSPMLVLTDTSDSGMAMHPANQSGAGEYASIDLLNIFRSMTKYTTLATNPKEAVLGTQIAIKHSMTGRPGPACVLMRSAAIGGQVDMETPPFIHPTQGYLNIAPSVAPQNEVDRVAKLLASAKRPVIVAGNGIHLSDAHPQLQDLAELLAIPVATTYKGKSAISETHPLAVGMMGVYGQQTANATIGEADVILVVGAKLTPQDTLGETPNMMDPKRQKLVQIDIEPRNAGWTFPLDIGLIGDAKGILTQLIEAARPIVATQPADKRGRESYVRRQRQAHSYYDDPTAHSNASPIYPQTLVRVLHDTLDPATLLTLDAGNNRVWMAHFYQAKQAKTFFVPGGLAGMGWSLPAALGIKLAYPNRPVVGVTGDGGFMMSIHAISTALQYDLPVVWVVFNDYGLGMVRQHQVQDKKVIASEFINTDYGAAARGLGAWGVQVNNPRDLATAVRDAVASQRPAVVDVVIDRDQLMSDFRNTARRPTET
ncbi:MAG: thiamine pyrophosphate-binding protein, partial [Chloroflexi bacterium]|nr:thiamine pyrophosphate-binding protein [Chloroflexota bacterium]